MYDNVHFWLERRGIADKAWNAIPGFLYNPSVITDNTGREKYQGVLNGLNVMLSDCGLSITGSLSKFHNGSNVYLLNRADSARAINRISDLLHIDIGPAKVTYLEFGSVFPMQHPVWQYLHLLGDYRRLQRVQVTNDSIRFEGKGRKKPKVIAVYDKLADARAKNLDYPTALEGANLLRYELRLRGHLARRVGMANGLTASVLPDRIFYRNLAFLYINEYKTITKYGMKATESLDGITTPKDAIELFIAGLMKDAGPERVPIFIQMLKNKRVFTDPNNYTRVKKKLQSYQQMSVSNNPDLLKELDEAVLNSCAFV